MNKNIKTINELGQSLWYDNMRRSLLSGGEMEGMIRDGVIRGVTSNPTIFEKAISGSADYDEAFLLLAKPEASVDDIYLALVEEDIRRTADLLRPVYDESHAVDGFVSLEVAPELAYDAPGTIRDALKLVTLLDRPNVMIKVPGTRECVQAVRELTFKGVSVNVTLLFSLSQYEEAAQAYLEGLEARLANGEKIDTVASVASFFVSRVDTLIDKKLADEFPGREESLRGRAAVANAKLAYQLGKEIFSGPRWEKIAAKGGRPQRLLWASTGTKDPRYSNTLYVDELIGRDTVNTVPPQTLEAFMKSGHPAPTLTQGLDEAEQLIETLGELGISLEEVGETLQKKGVAAFSNSMQSLMTVIGERRAKIIGG